MGDLTPAMESYITWRQKKGTALTIYSYEKSGINLYNLQNCQINERIISKVNFHLCVFAEWQIEKSEF